MAEQPTQHAGPRAQDFAARNDWIGYFGAVHGKPARETLIGALDRFQKEWGGDRPPGGAPHLAVDLACGEGRDSLELLRRGWRVLAIDPMPEGIAMLRARVPEDQGGRLTTRTTTFRDSQWPTCSLLNCSFALPFCPAPEFDDLWIRIVASIQPGGRFAGQFFGERDTWARCGHTLGHSRQQVSDLLNDFTLELLQEEEKDDKDALGNPKHWHVFHIVARKRVSDQAGER